MSESSKPATTSIAFSTAEDVFIRDRSLCKELIGQVTFTEMLFFGILGRMPSPAERQVVDACLVTLMEHGLTPSALTTRLIYGSAPESMGAAVGAGLAGVGSLFVGTMDGCGALLRRIVEASAPYAETSDQIAREFRESKRALPGFGHPQHKPDDPRAIRLIEVCREQGLAGAHVDAVLALSSAVDRVFGKHITINVTGAIAALLADCGVPYEILRGFAVIARAAGLVAHIHEEQHSPTMRAIWQAAEMGVCYESKPSVPPSDSGSRR